MQTIEQALEKLAALPDADPVMTEVYRAYIALARFNEKEADAVMERLGERYPDDDVCLFEAAQYYARKCDYGKAVTLYERAFEIDKRRPRFQDALMGIAEIYEIEGEYGKAAETWDRITDLLENEWGLTEEVELEQAKKEKARLAELAQRKRQ